MSGFLLAHPTLTALLITLSWGYAFVAIRQCLQVIDATDLVIVRFAPLVLILGIDMARDWPRWRAPLKHWKLLIVLAIVYTWGYHYLLNVGETIILPGLAALIVACAPLFVFLSSLALKRETASTQKVLGLALALCGLILSVAYSDQAIGLAREGVSARTYLFGVGATLVTPIAWAIYTQGIKTLTVEFNPFIVTGWVMFLGTLPGFLLIDAPLIAALREATLAFWIGVLYLGLIAGLWAVLWWSKLLEQGDATKVTAFIYTVPVFSLAFSYFTDGERLTALSGLGAALILAGLWVLNRPRPSNPSPPAPLPSSKTRPGEGRRFRRIMRGHE